MTVINFDFDRLTRTYSLDQQIHVDAEVKTHEPIKWKEAYCNIFCVRTVNANGHGLVGFDSPIPHTPENTLWANPIPVKWPGVINDGFKFSFDFKVPSNKNLTESVRGKFCSIDYFVEVVIKRGMLKPEIILTRTFYVVFPPPAKRPTGDAIEMIMDRKHLKKGSPPVDFKAKVHLDTPVASFKQPPRGWITVLNSNQPIEAITVSYMRTEKIFNEKGVPTVLVSEVCRMQIAENDPAYNIIIPFNLEWVRILVSPDIETPQFSMNIGLKIRILFDNNGYANHVIPLKLCRDMAY
ncbi:hypothetical protein TRFO_36457 [Tritrichomonas foetus]|uniref:Arrestin-like N-terminal domain-containing protein n=1 Tax=Tritrichomonas foetus TaxID=1144522 RepID=A0A1J4JGD4_9EUKA|nr:hypothetical protein TRFO_36457 [Tritrichomonas foetus]|eukprot:OHS97359.1 hypothetical protein TRFO_36457 [Tritrichomonas foetus]